MAKVQKWMMCGWGLLVLLIRRLQALLNDPTAAGDAHSQLTADQICPGASRTVGTRQLQHGRARCVSESESGSGARSWFYEG